MKYGKRIPRGIALLGITMLSLGLVAFAQTSSTPSSIDGYWQGTLGAGTNKLRLALKITKSNDGKISGKFDSLDQGASFPLEAVTFDGAAFGFEIKIVGGVYTGVLSKTGAEITGMWTQTGVPAQPLNFTRSSSPPAEPAAPLMSSAGPPVPIAGLQAALDREMAPALDHGV